MTDEKAREGRSTALADQATAFAAVLAEEFGCPFAFYHALSGELLIGDDGSALSLSPESIHDLAGDGRVRATPLNGAVRLSLLLYHQGRPALLAVGRVDTLVGGDREAERLRRWGQAVADRLRLTEQLFERPPRPDDAPATAPAALAWEALLTVDHLLRRLRIHKEPERTRRRVLEAAFGLVPARTLAWVPATNDGDAVFLGEACLAPADARHLADGLARDADGRDEPVFRAAGAGAPWESRFPSVTTLLALPVGEAATGGWVLALNKKAGPPGRGSGTSAPPFRRSDAALLTPFVSLLDLHARASGRYQDLKDLLVGLTRSLTAALDAKDSYTYGHSERVARIAVELGRELGLGADDVSDIYLAGLLHDVGKIGIRDAILLKPGPLTAEEFEHIKQHVTIGYTILADLHPIRNLLPGVLWHHERWDGKGYPDGLVGESIPLLARVIAVADAYDAMSTARPYREALPFRRVEEILTQGAGSQWDGRVIEAFLRCRQKVHAIRQRGVGESLHAAIDGALRSSGGRAALPSRSRSAAE